MKFVDCSYVSEDGGIVVMVSGKCLREIHLLALRARGQETGSVLMGRSSADGMRALVERCGPIPDGSKGYPRSYMRASKGLESYYEKVFRSTKGKVHYIGEWHSHPNSDVEPSGVDERTMSDISMDMDGVGVVSIIIGGDFVKTFEVGLNVYLGRRRVRMRPCYGTNQ